MRQKKTIEFKPTSCLTVIGVGKKKQGNVGAMVTTGSLCKIECLSEKVAAVGCKTRTWLS